MASVERTATVTTPVALCFKFTPPITPTARARFSTPGILRSKLGSQLNPMEPPLSDPFQATRRNLLASLAGTLSVGKSTTAEFLAGLSAARGANSSPLSGVKWYFYASGTTTPQSVFATIMLDATRTNPVAADSGGRFAPIHFDASLVYRGILKTATGTTLRDVDPIDAGLIAQLSQAGGSNAIDFLQSHADVDLQMTREKLRRIVDVDDFHLAPDADDTNAFARAVASLISTGGVIHTDPKKRYLISASVSIISAKHILITGGNFGQVYDATGPGIAITAPLDSVFRAQGPTRASAGGVSFYGISFYDATGSGGAPGKNTIGRAALDMYDAPLSTIEACQFHFLKGTAIRSDFFAQSSINGCRFRYCGDAGKKVVHFGSTNSTYCSQAVNFHDNRMEVCYGDSYVYTGNFTQDVTIANCVFEAATSEYPTSSVPFLDLAGLNTRLMASAINRNLAQAVILRGGRGQIFGCSFATGSAATETIFCLASRWLIFGNSFEDLRTGNSIRVTGMGNSFFGNRMYVSGGISFEGSSNHFNNNYVENPSKRGPGYLITLIDYCTADNNHFQGADLSGGTYVPAVGAVILYAATSEAIGNTFRGWAGKNALRIEAAGAAYMPNKHDGVGTFVSAALNPMPVASSANQMRLPARPGETLHIHVTGTETITEIVSGYQYLNMTAVLVFQGALTVRNLNNLQLTGDMKTSTGKKLYLLCDGTHWTEISRWG